MRPLLSLAAFGLGLFDGLSGGWVRLAPLHFSRRAYLRAYTFGRFLREWCVPPRGRRRR